MDEKFEALRLENQICFPLYAASREIIKMYKPHLDKIDLTYTQYIVMMLLWDKREMTSKEIGERLYLDSGTLTPLLKKLEEKCLINRSRDTLDERNLLICITEKGMALRNKAAAIPKEMKKCSGISSRDARELYRILYKMLGQDEK